ncbi:MAG: glycosyltransferase [Coleofasciculus sp. C2-GNP5-27]
MTAIQKSFLRQQRSQFTPIYPMSLEKKWHEREKIKAFPPRQLNGISIVIPTFKRVKMCQTLLESLQASRQYFSGDLEVIVVDNSPLKEAEQIRELCVAYQASYDWQKIGVGAKRNYGAKLANYPIILFIDSDCEATPDLLEEHLRFYQTNPQTVAVLGKTRFKGYKSLVWQAIQLSPFIIPFRLADQEGQRIWGPSNNLSCRTDVFKRVGGFDETFPQKPGGEDVDFGYRLYKAGHLLTTNPQALVYHTTETWNDIHQVVNRLFNWGKAEFYLYHKHGEYLYYDCPKGLGIVLLMLPIAVAMVVINQSLQWLLLPLIFLGVNFVSRIIVHLGYHPDRLVQINKVFLAEVFAWVYEFGLTMQCVNQRWFLPLYHRLIVLPDDAVMVWNSQILYTWITVAQLLVTVTLFQLL